MPPTLDPQVVALAKAVRDEESGGNPSIKGKSGEYGAYQYIPSTWTKQSAAAGVNVPLDKASLADQNKVWYTWAKQKKDQGYTPGQIISMQNAGEGEPDAYTGKFSNGAPSRGVNKEGVAFDVPAYSTKVAQKYQQYKSQSTSGYNPTPFSKPDGTSQFNLDLSGNTPVEAPKKPEFFQGLMQDLNGTNPDNIGTQLENAAKGAGNFLFPIVGDVKDDLAGKSSKSVLQQTGDAALSALPFIPGLGEVRGAGLLAKAGGIIGKNALVGYGAGTAANLAQGQSVGQALTPQLSNVGGAVLGGGAAGALSKLGARTGDQAVIDKLEKVYGDALGATKTGIKASSKIIGRGADAPETFLAHAGIAPETDELNGRTVFKTGEDSATYKAIQDRASALTDLRDKLIDSADTSDLGNGMTMQHTGSSLSDLKNEAIAQANKTFMGTERATAVNHLDNEFKALQEQFGSNDISLKQLNTVKKYFQGNTNFDATRPSTLTSANKLAAGVAKTAVEKDAEKAGIPGLAGLNKMIRQHLDFLNTDGKKGLLDKLNGQTLKGGRIGIHVREGVGGAIGGIIGNTLGKGIAGDIGGVVLGGIAGHHLSKLEQLLSVGGPKMAARIGKIAQEDPQAIQELMQILKEKGVQAPEGLLAPSLVPKNKSTGLVGNLITKGAMRAGASL